MDFLIDPNFQGVNRHFLLPFENETQRISYNRYDLPTKEIKSYNVMIDGKNIFDQLIRKFSKNCNRSRIWLHNYLFVGLELFKKLLLNDSNRFK